MTTHAFNHSELEAWVESAARVFLVLTTGKGERIVMTGRIVRVDGTGVFVASESARDGRGQFARFEQIETLRVAGRKSEAPAEAEVAT